MYRAFTSTYKGRAKVLRNKVGITDPTRTRMIGIAPQPELDTIAIWDTGATNSVITHGLAQRLDLHPTGMVRVNHAGGSSVKNTYVVDFWLLNGVIIQSVKVTEGEISGADVLIGMDIIGIGDFAVSNYEDITSFSFRVPSKEKTDYVAIEKAPAKSNKIGRNERCTCGSGKKYKHCCGK